MCNYQGVVSFTRGTMPYDGYDAVRFKKRYFQKKHQKDTKEFKKIIKNIPVSCIKWEWLWLQWNVISAICPEAVKKTLFHPLPLIHRGYWYRFYEFCLSFLRRIYGNIDLKELLLILFLYHIVIFTKNIFMSFAFFSGNFIKFSRFLVFSKEIVLRTTILIIKLQ